MKIFNEIVEIEEDTIKITVSCKKRAHVMEPKVVYKNNVENLIPNDIRDKVKVTSSPSDKLSNMNIPGHTQSAT